MVTFDRARVSVGLSIFVEFYEDYRRYYEHQTSANKKRLAQKLLESNPRASSINGQITRISYTLEIFSNYWERDMLRAAIESSHPSISNEIKAKAKEILKRIEA
ncbi:hypothetical protein [Cohnella cellulosilytica]|uniref:Uncharacterized protein n=1 Tax=Cohnella cellulosilytica TaxID=986710 RepID=A0ABW2FFB1_9BACL